MHYAGKIHALIFIQKIIKLNIVRLDNVQFYGAIKLYLYRKTLFAMLL